MDRQAIDEIRRFNRFYTTHIGVLQDGWLDSPFSLTEVRVLYEIAHQDRPTAGDVIKALDLDGGYLSRILQRFARRRLITRTTSDTDARQTHLALSARGRETLAPLEALSRDQVTAMLGALTPADQRRVIDAMRTIQTCLGAGADAGQAGARAGAMAPRQGDRTTPPVPPFTLRTHRPGDMGWIVHRHGALYSQEYGWNAEFEALVAEIAAHFLRHFDPARERCWMAERASPLSGSAVTDSAATDNAVTGSAVTGSAVTGSATIGSATIGSATIGSATIGSVMLVEQSDDVAKLRLLLVEPTARGLGVGKRLVDECVRFAREVGYRKITLWTQANLLAARGIYRAAGFRLVAEEPKHSFGHDLVSETWEMDL